MIKYKIQEYLRNTRGGKMNGVYSSFLLALYKGIHLGPNHSLRDFLNV